LSGNAANQGKHSATERPWDNGGVRKTLGQMPLDHTKHRNPGRVGQDPYTLAPLEGPWATMRLENTPSKPRCHLAPNIQHATSRCSNFSLEDPQSRERRPLRLRLSTWLGLGETYRVTLKEGERGKRCCGHTYA